MSKIPQGEWNAIAARYQGGESISRIARSYGCTPPAIHYILKRSRLKPQEAAAPPATPRPTEATGIGLVRAAAGRASAPAHNREPSLNGAAGQSPSPIGGAEAGQAGVGAAGKSLAPPLGGAQAAEAASRGPQSSTPSISASAPPALTRMGETGQGTSGGRTVPAVSGLDLELYARAEAAIELFRSSFNAAMAEGAPTVRERLRQAANDLMRVAARTTMVLDRINASSERAARAHNYPRSAHAGEDLTKLR